jgi:hypothetical protein
MSSAIQRPTKKRIVNKNLRFGYDRENANNSSFTSVYMKRMRKALRSNLNEQLSIHKVKTTPKEMDDFLEQFMESQVRMDVHYLKASRRSEGGVVEAVPLTFQTGARVIMNGMSIDSRNRRGLNSNETTSMLVIVDQYTGSSGLHQAHAIGAFKLNNVLYAFNSWGKGYLEADQPTSQVLPDNAVWEYLRKKYRCSTVVVFTGKNYQATDPHGVCVGFANDFGTYMYTHLMLQNAQVIPGLEPFPGPEPATKRIGPMVYSNKFNDFVEDVVLEYRGGFGKNTGNTTCPLALKGMFNELRRTAMSVNPNPVDTFEVMTRAINKNAEARSKLLEILRNNDRTRVEEAQHRMRDILRTMDGRLYEIKNSRLNQDILTYLRSGNINISDLVNLDLDKFKVLSRTINKNVEIRKELLEILRNNDQGRVKLARARVRSILRAADNRFQMVNSNALNADVLRYLQSGNINPAQLKSTNVRMN